MSIVTTAMHWSALRNVYTAPLIILLSIGRNVPEFKRSRPILLQAQPSGGPVGLIVERTIYTCVHTTASCRNLQSPSAASRSRSSRSNRARSA